MTVRSVEALQQYLGRLCDEAVPPEDAVLLKRFVEANDRDAFAMLIARHGPMVLGTARRLVDDSHDAEDVFQAVFLSLARLARTIRHGRTLPAWLHRATGRIAAKIRANRSTRFEPLPEVDDHSDPGAGLVWEEVRQALDEELQRLPDRLRSPLLLCYLSGLTRDEAARQLGWSLGTLKRRIEQGRKILRSRLERRGIAATGLAIAVLTPGALRAAVSKSLLDATVRLTFSDGAIAPSQVAVLVLHSAATTKGLAMKSMLALLAAIGLAVGIYAGTGPAGPPKKADGIKRAVKPAQVEKVTQRDDPLPPGSTLRFGTSRFRHGIPVSTMAISADGKRAVAVNGNHVLGATRVFDLVSGRVLYPIGGWEGSTIEAAAISPDGRTFVTKQDFSVRVRDAATGKELRKVELKRANSYSQNEWLTFTPDGKAVAVTSQGKVIHLIDVESGKTIRDFSNENPESSLKGGFTTVLGIAFSPDGKLMASGGFTNDQGTYFARLWDVATGREIRRFVHGKRSYGIRSLAFSPDAKTLATRSHDGRLRLFEVATGKSLKTFPKDGGGRRPDTVAFAPDGKTVAAAGDSIRLYEVATGKERLCIDQKQATGLRFTNGGKTLMGAVKGAIYRWDAATGKALTPEAGDSVIEQILVTSDGRRVVTRGQDGDAHLWDGTNGKHLRAFQAGWQRGMAMSPDGRFLVWPVADKSVRFTEPQSPGLTYDGSRLRLYDVAADKFVDRFPGFKGEAHDLTFTDNGRLLVTVDHRIGTVRIWNVASGKVERSFQAAPKPEQQQSHRVWRTALSPDGKTIAVAYDAVRVGGRLGIRNIPHFVRLCDVAKGKVTHVLNGHRHYVLDLAFSPDGRLLATADEKQAFVWDAATGSRVAAFPDGLPAAASAVAFSRDGRALAAALPKGVIQLWEVASWTVQCEFKGHRDRVTALTFAPSGRLLSGSMDTTVLAWDVRPPRVAIGSLEAAWIDLAKRNSAEAFKSEGRFLAAPSAAVKFFGDKIKPVEPPDAKRIQQLLADLDSAGFDVRESASKALRNLGEQAKPYLENAVQTTKSSEVRARAAKILEGLKETTLEQLRQVRAVLVLELIDSDGSRKLLKKWAGGLKGATLTVESAAALKRLEGAVKARR